MKSGKHLSKEVSVIQGLYVEFIFHNFVDGLFARKSQTSCAGAL
jgi:hypothetical protein